MTNNATAKTIQELKNLSADQGVAPHIPREGMMGKASNGVDGTAGSANTGGGGGGAGSSAVGGNGGSGIVIISYLTGSLTSGSALMSFMV